MAKERLTKCKACGCKSLSRWKLAAERKNGKRRDHIVCDNCGAVKVLGKWFPDDTTS